MKRKTVTTIVAAAAVVAASAAALVTGNAMAEDVEPTIIGGHDATEDYPFIASVQWETKGNPNAHHCGAALVAPQWIVTAGHCAVDADGNPKDPDPIHISIGSNDRTDGTIIQVDEVIPHPEYGKEPTPNGSDVALMHLATPATQTPIKIGKTETVGSDVRQLGWGYTEIGGTVLPEYLQELDSKLLDLKTCQFGDEWEAVEGDLCVESPNGEKGGCNGDSGSPLIQKNAAGEWVVLGVDSRAGGEQCLDTDEVYTSTVYYAKWIKQIIEDEQLAA